MLPRRSAVVRQRDRCAPSSGFPAKCIEVSFKFLQNLSLRAGDSGISRDRFARVFFNLSGTLFGFTYVLLQTSVARSSGSPTSSATTAISWPACVFAAWDRERGFSSGSPMSPFACCSSFPAMFSSVSSTTHVQPAGTGLIPCLSSTATSTTGA